MKGLLYCITLVVVASASRIIVGGMDLSWADQERDYAKYAVGREWDRLMTWHAGDTVKQCYRLGNPQYYPDSVYDRMLEECGMIAKYECWFTSGTRRHEDAQARLSESKRAYKAKYKKAYTKCQAARERQQGGDGPIKYYAECNYGVTCSSELRGCNHVVKYPERDAMVVASGLELFTALKVHGQDIPDHLARYERLAEMPALTPLPDEGGDQL